MKYVAISLILASLITNMAWSQKQNAVQQNGWFMYFGNHILSEKWGLHTEYQWRRSEVIKESQQSLIRLGIDYKLSERNTLTAGYGYIVSYPYGEQPIVKNLNEHRIWQTLTLNHTSGRFYLNHRYRLEQRFIESATSDERVYKNRIRYRFMATLPLAKKTLEPNTFFISMYEEVFIGFGKNIASNVMEQNRLYAALGYKFTGKMNIQTGYLNQLIIKGDGVRQEINHTLQLALFYNLDFRPDEQ
ncbi:DUF2490 domain-containing protein [Fulvivirga sp. M361]|uniref:DUF2490 domain-containing protein n=1 Tax=Fulvivirga sp. M361 TaxID=2594266 RepID=UPI0016257F5C|nr:DUF2490 domain-containing protein [Fulvivirga sp. M361]